MQQENQDISATLKDIKQSFRLLMNGVTAQSMREKGLDYHINWGANLLHLKEMAEEYIPDRRLAQALWQEDVRECKIMATLLMPKEEFTIELAMLWIEQTRSQEICEIATMNLYQHLPYAAELALKLIASGEKMMQMHGYGIIGRVFANGNSLEERDLNEFVDQTISTLSEEDVHLRHCALNAMQRFADSDDSCHLMALSALKTIKMEDWLL